MRHRMKNKKLGKPTDQRLAMLKTQVTQLFLHGKLETTEARARATKRLAEKTITIARRGDLQAMRLCRKVVSDRDAFKRLFEEIAPAYKERKGGYLRLLKLPPRHGDAAPMAIITMVED
jgi:large subunit ribosomal protein L17